ncbi:MAG: MarC family protein [Alphaproteobacteria bacterium]|nr:MarC family protein [Alphaproteobacteria bacterium]
MQPELDGFLVAFAALFAVIGPVDVAVIYAGLTTKNTVAEKNRFAVKGVLIGGIIIGFFAVFGRNILDALGITLPALKIAGGILLLLIAIDMVFARHSGGTSTTREENEEAWNSEDPSIFPVAMPLIAGPGAIGAIIVLMGDTGGSLTLGAIVIAALLSVLAIQLVLLLMAGQVQKVLGRTGSDVIARVMGVLLAGLAVQFMLTGLRISGLFTDMGGGR